VYQLEGRRDRVTYVRVANHDMTKFLGARVSWQCHVRKKNMDAVYDFADVNQGACAGKTRCLTCKLREI
jgi:hypothetical protein